MVNRIKRGSLREDAVIAVCYMAVGLVLNFLEFSEGGPLYLDTMISVFLTIVAAAAVGLRRKKPILMLGVVAAVTVVMALTGGGIFVYFLIFEWFFSATLFCSKSTKRYVPMVAGLLVIGTTVYAQWQSGSATISLLVFLQITVLCMTPIWWAQSLSSLHDLAISDRQRVEAEGKAAIRAEKLLTAETELTNQHLKAILARDLHDTVASRISAIAMQSATAVSIADVGVKDAVFESIRKGSLEALREMRATIHLLKCDEVEERHSCDRHRARFMELVAAARSTGIRVSLDDGVELENQTKIGDVYLIAQEALTNVLKHAPHSPITISFKQEDRKFILTVLNDFVPLAGDGNGERSSLVRCGSGQGLANMQARARNRGGKFSAGPTASGSSWMVRAEFAGDAFMRGPEG